MEGFWRPLAFSSMIHLRGFCLPTFDRLINGVLSTGRHSPSVHAEGDGRLWEFLGPALSVDADVDGRDTDLVEVLPGPILLKRCLLKRCLPEKPPSLSRIGVWTSSPP